MKTFRYIVCGVAFSLFMGAAAPSALGAELTADAEATEFGLQDETHEADAQKKLSKDEKKKAKNHAKFEKRQAKKKAKQEKRQLKAVAKAKKEAEKNAEKLAKLEPQTVYMYGAGINFLDSVVYVTDFQSLDNIYIEPDGQLREHYAYTAEWKFYLESTHQLENETCAVYYMTNEKKAVKRYTKMDAKLRKSGFLINRVSRNDFAFTRQEPSKEQEPKMND